MEKTLQQKLKEARDAYLDSVKKYPPNHPQRQKAFETFNNLSKKGLQEQEQKNTSNAFSDVPERVGSFFNNIVSWLNSPAPNFNITTDPTGRPLNSQGLKPGKYMQQSPGKPGVASSDLDIFLLPGTYSTEKLPENQIPSGKRQVPLLGGNGQVIGWTLENMPTPTQTTPPTVQSPTVRPTPSAGFPSVTADTAERGAGSQQLPGQQVSPEARVEADKDRPQNLLPVNLTEEMQKREAEEKARQQNVIDSDKANRKTQRQIVEAMLTQAGFNNMSKAFIDKAIKAYRQDPSSEYIVLQLRNEPEYKERFGGIEKLREENPAFTEADYILEEKQYAKVARDLPDYLKPTQKDYARFMELGVSPLELQNRIQSANEAAANANPYFKEALKKNYNMTDSDIVGFYLDPTKTEEQIKKVQDVLSYDAELLQQKLTISTEYLESLSGRKSVQEVAGAGAQVALQTGTLGKLAAIEGDQALTEEEQLGGRLGLDTEAIERERGLRSRERARFSGTGAGTRMFSRNMSGSI
jgi:hypothetical protein